MIQKSNSIVNVDLSKLEKNVDTLAGYLDEDTRVMAVVKSDAYGHGAVPVARRLESRVGAFAVNDIHEGIELREASIAKPILVFEVPEKSLASQYRVHNLTATISAEQHFEWLPNGTSYHLNFDTGMGRLGFAPEEAERVSKLMQQNRELFCTGLYTHFATASDPGSSMVDDQHELFTKIQQYFPSTLTVHTSNTGAAVFYENPKFDMVRLGIGLYGYPPGETDIEGVDPILQWKSKLVQVKRIAAQHTVSYGAIWKAPCNGYLGILPVGYDDGIKRNLSGKISVRINNKIYDLAGRVTMNYCMVDLKDDVYEPGTEVEILGEHSDAWDWGQKIGTIPYEILTSINPKIPREYID